VKRVRYVVSTARWRVFKVVQRPAHVSTTIMRNPYSQQPFALTIADVEDDSEDDDDDVVVVVVLMME